MTIVVVRFIVPVSTARGIDVTTPTNHQNLLLSISKALDNGEIALAFALRCLLVDKILKGEK